MSPTPTLVAQSQSHQLLSTLAIIGLSVGVFVLLATVMVGYMVLRSKKRTVHRERQARYTAWSTRSNEQKYRSNRASSRSMSTVFKNHFVPISRLPSVHLRMTIPSPSIPNLFVSSPKSPESFPRDIPPPQYPRQYAHNQPVLTGTPRFFKRASKFSWGHQRAMSMSASSESDFGNAIEGFGDVETFPDNPRFSDYPESVKSFIQPATTIPPPCPCAVSRPLSLRKPVPIINYLPDTTSPPLLERSAVSTLAPAPGPSTIPTPEPVVVHPYKLATPTPAPLRTMKSTRIHEFRAMNALIDSLDADIEHPRGISAAGLQQNSRPTFKRQLSGLSRLRSVLSGFSGSASASASSSASDTSVSRANSIMSYRTGHGVDFSPLSDSAAGETYMLTQTEAQIFRAQMQRGNSRISRTGSRLGSSV
ncbi:hypothetical protein BU17DRAFT_91609 [Hysterangium stoloniferum]|nr:hypothetical protein BU17DRAFT_91609 [Hysterangium stoloniferum]